MLRFSIVMVTVLWHRTGLGETKCLIELNSTNRVMISRRTVLVKLLSILTPYALNVHCGLGVS